MSPTSSGGYLRISPGFLLSPHDTQQKHLPENKEVFALYTCGQKWDSYTKELKDLVSERHGKYLGDYGCLGFDTFGPFKLVGGIAGRMEGRAGSEEGGKRMKRFNRNHIRWGAPLFCV